MGNRRLYKLSQVCSIFDIILLGGSQFIDFETENILEKSPTDESYQALKMIFKQINWNKKRSTSKDKQGDKDKEKKFLLSLQLQILSLAPSIDIIWLNQRLIKE